MKSGRVILGATRPAEGTFCLVKLYRYSLKLSIFNDFPLLNCYKQQHLVQFVATCVSMLVGILLCYLEIT